MLPETGISAEDPLIFCIVERFPASRALSDPAKAAIGVAVTVVEHDAGRRVERIHVAFLIQCDADPADCFAQYGKKSFIVTDGPVRQ